MTPLPRGARRRVAESSVYAPVRMVAFSVFIPAYNGAEFLSGAIESVRAQTYSGWELLIGDNASEDDLAAVVATFDDPRIRYERFDRYVDIFANFNRTMALCRHPWVYLLPVDDRLAPTCLARIAETIEASRGGRRPLAMVVTAARRVGVDGRSVEVDYYGVQGPGHIDTGVYDAHDWLLAACAPGSPPWGCGAYNRKIVESMGSFYSEVDPSMSADLELTLRIAAYGDVAYIDEPLLAVTGWSESHTQGRAGRNRARGERQTTEGAAFVSALRVHEARRAVSTEERRAVHAAVARSYLRRAAAHRYRQDGRGRPGALVDLVRGARSSPRTMLAPRSLIRSVAIVLAPARALAWVRRRALDRRAAAGARTSSSD